MLSPLFDPAVRRQVLLERLKSGQIQGFNRLFRGIEKAVRGAFGNLDGELAGATRRALARFLKGIEKDVSREYARQLKLYRRDLEQTAGIYAAAEARDLEKAIAGAVTLKVPAAKKAFAGAVARPMSHSGETLDEFLNGFAGKEVARVRDAIRRGSTNGLTNQEIIRSIIGTKARKYKDGILATSRRNADAVVRTATQHVASSARQDLWEANKDVVQAYEWVSTLDRKTTQLCKSLDGREFELGKGPTPPIHIRCRSTTIAVLSSKYDFLREGRTRSAEFGPVSGDEDYYGWLKRQSKSVQTEALGPTRAKLFRDGGLTPEEFSKLNLGRNFEPLTLDEMRTIDPEAFERAGLPGA